MKRLVRKAESELFNDFFIEELVEKHMIKIDESAKFNAEEPATHYDPNMPESIYVYYTGKIDMTQYLSEEQIKNVQELIQDPYFKEMLQRDLLYTFEKHSGLPQEEVDRFDWTMLEDADIETKVDGNQIVIDARYED